MSTRLTNSMREKIMTSLLQRTFKPRRQALDTNSSSLFERVVKASWDEHYDTAMNLPPEMLQKSIALIVSLKCDKYEKLRLTGDYPLPFPHDLPAYHAAICLDEPEPNRVTQCVLKDAALVADLRAHAKAVMALNKEREAAEAEIKAVLSSISTSKKLFSVWPELASVPGLDLEPESTAGQQMAVSLVSLNKTLSLPVEKAASTT
jgi:hypothetical protein